MSNLKVCIFGYGKWSKKFIPNLNTNKYNIEKIITNKKLEDKKFIKKISKKNLSKFDIIYLAKDPERNYKFFTNNFKFMKSVVFEKPLSLSLLKINKIIKLCKLNKIKLVVSYPQIYSKIFNYISTKNSKRIDIVNCGNGPIRVYLDPINDYIPVVLMSIIKLMNINSYKLFKLKNDIYKNKLNKNKLIFKSSFILNDIVFNIKVGNNSKKRQNYIKLYQKNGIIKKFNFINQSILEKSKMLNLSKKNDNITYMLDYLNKSNFNEVFKILQKEKVAYKLKQDLIEYNG